MPRADFKFAYRLRARYSEVDAQAVVFNARYLDYADQGIAEYFRALGISVVPGPATPEFHTAHCAVDYKAPIRLDEEIDVCVRAARIGRSSVSFAIEIHGAGRDDLRAAVEEVYVHVDLAAHAPEPLPAPLIARFEGYEGKALVAPRG